MNVKRPKVIAIVGPTCTGKTALSIKIAEKHHGEIIACDSRTVYKYMDVGTAKPTMEERHGVPHHMFDVVEPDCLYTVADYKTAAQTKLEEMFDKGIAPIVCGGTGFYARALLEGLAIPEVPPQIELRDELSKQAQEQGNDVLYAKLKELDPASAEKLNPNDIFRVVRALEVSIVTGLPFSQLAKKVELPFDVIWIGLKYSDRQKLRNTLAQRFFEQLRNGLVDEVESLYKRYGPVRSIINSVNYFEFIPYIEGKVSRQDAIDTCLVHNNQLARKQMIWFKKNSEINWFHVDEIESESLFLRALDLISEKLAV